MSTHLLLFICDDCQVQFYDEPDDTGYEQAKCPHCDGLCVTLEYEFQDRERLRQGNHAIFDIFFHALGFSIFLPMFWAWRWLRPPQHRRVPAEDYLLVEVKRRPHDEP